MGKGGYIGGSTVIRGPIGYVARGKPQGVMTMAEARADVGKRDRRLAEAREQKARKAAAKLAKTAETAARAAKAASKSAARAKIENPAHSLKLVDAQRIAAGAKSSTKKKKRRVDPMEGVEVRRYTARTLRLRKLED